MSGKRFIEAEEKKPTGDEADAKVDKKEEDEQKEETAPVTKKTKTEDKKEEGKEINEKQEEKKEPEKPKAASEAQVNHEKLSENALVVFGLHPLITKEEMNEVMSKYGKVERLETRKAFASTYCFCDYKTSKEAHHAIEKLNGTKLREKEIIVKLVNDNKSRSKPFAG
jgi:RNA recognition motif-containing protein